MKTIAAIATPRTVGGIGVVRISGDEAFSVADKIFKSESGKKASDIKGYTALFGAVFENGKKLDEAILLKFKAPKSYTGEDVAEISCHGGIFITERVLNLALKAGADLADAGEFTKRAFGNGKMDLIEAEAVADMISAESEIAYTAALSLKNGALSKEIEKITESLLAAAANISAYIDYPDDDIPDLDTKTLIGIMENNKEILAKLINTFEAGQVYREGIKTAIVGKPNVGKSTLMNMLLGYDKSIVTDIAGTTRDVVEEIISLDGIKLHLFDTAGIRKTDDIIEEIGVHRAKEKINEASLVIAVFDNTDKLTDEDTEIIKKIESKNKIGIINKIDSKNKIDVDFIKNNFEYTVMTSAKYGGGKDEIKNAIFKMYQLNLLDPTAATLATERQKNTVTKAFNAIDRGIKTLKSGLTADAVSVDIDIALNALCQLTGEKATELVTAEIFSRFCVGK